MDQSNSDVAAPAAETEIGTTQDVVLEETGTDAVEVINDGAGVAEETEVPQDGAVELAEPTEASQATEDQDDGPIALEADFDVMELMKLLQPLDDVNEIEQPAFVECKFAKHKKTPCRDLIPIQKAWVAYWDLPEPLKTAEEKYSAAPEGEKKALLQRFLHPGGKFVFCCEQHAKEIYVGIRTRKVELVHKLDGKESTARFTVERAQPFREFVGELAADRQRLEQAQDVILNAVERLHVDAALMTWKKEHQELTHTAWNSHLHVKFSPAELEEKDLAMPEFFKALAAYERLYHAAKRVGLKLVRNTSDQVLEEVRELPEYAEYAEAYTRYFRKMRQDNQARIDERTRECKSPFVKIDIWTVECKRPHRAAGMGYILVAGYKMAKAIDDFLHAKYQELGMPEPTSTSLRSLQDRLRDIENARAEYYKERRAAANNLDNFVDD